MKITQVETFMVSPRWLFVKLSTDEGLSGWGEATLEGRSATVRAAIHEFDEYLVGQDPARIEQHWQVMTKSTFYRGGPVLSSAVSGIDQALWDLAGKLHGVPVHDLLGGAVRDRVRVYSWIGGDSPNQVAEQIEQQLDAGFTAVKMNASGRLAPIGTVRETDGILERAATAREALGPDADFALDFHGRFSTAMARRVVAELEPFRPLFIEEPVLPEHAHRLRDVVDSTAVPIATGERLFSRSDFLPVLSAGIAVAQPDLSHCGGISEGRRIAVLAETFDVLVAPHCPLGPLGLAASIQVSLAAPNFLIQEQSMGIHYNQGADVLDYLVDTDVFQFVDGSCERLRGPGLGIEIDEAAVRRADALAVSWRGPVWRHDDGAFAEW